MSSEYRWLGVEEIAVGASSVTTLAVTMPSTATTIAYFVPGSCRVTVPEPTEQVLECEDTVEPDVTVIDEGVKSVEFATRDMDTSLLYLGFGGIVSGSDTWKASTTAMTLQEKSVTLKTKPVNGYYYQLTIPRVSLKAGKNLAMQNKTAESGQISFRCTIMQGTTPTGVKVPPYKIVRIAES